MIGRYQLFAIVLGLGAVNALIRPASVAVRDQGATAILNGFGVSFVIWLSIAWALYTLADSPQRIIVRVDYLAAVLITVGLLFPLAIFSWIVTGAGAIFWMHRRCKDFAARSALAVLAFAAFREPIASLALKLMATPLLAGDAAVVSGVLALWQGSAERVGNLVTGSNGHQLLVLTGCTSYTNMSIALLGWFAITKAALSPVEKINWFAGAGVAAAIFAINIGRLAIMGTGPDAYIFMHDGLGASLSEALMIVSTIIIAILGCNHGTSKRFLLGRT